MPISKKILAAVDNSGSSRRTVGYVADMTGGISDVHVGLLHLELPPRMIEWGGSEDTEIEGKVAQERADDYRELEKEAIVGGQALLKTLQHILDERKIDVVTRLVQFEEPLDPKNITEHILTIAKERDYGTLVVGRHTFSGLKRIFGHHVAGELVRAGQGFTIWVVE